MTTELLATVERARAVVAEYRGKGLTEQDTKNAIIEPILGTLGWPKHDLRRVRAEYRQTAKSNPVDYALMSASKPVLFLEAKALDKDIREHRFIHQTLSYATVAGVDWAIITNGEQWDLYSAFARVDADNKRFFSTTVDRPDFTDWMGWITPERLEANELERFWRLVVAERTVRTVVKGMFSKRDDALVALLVKRTRLEVADVAAALEMLRPRFDETGAGTLAEYLRGSSSQGPPTTRGADVTSSDRPGGPSAERVTSAPPSTRSSKLTGVSSAGLLPPTKGRKPAALIVGTAEYDVTSWRRLLLAAVQHVHATAPDRLDAAFAAPEFMGRKRRYLARDGATMASPESIPGGFVEANLSAKAIIRLVNKLLAFSGLLEGASYEHGDD